MDARDADQWWTSLPESRRIRLYRWLTQRPAVEPVTPGQTAFDFETVPSGERPGAH